MAKPQSVLRRPTFDLRFITESNSYHVVHDTGIELTNKYMTESVISVTTTNSMEDDSSAFSFVLAGDMKWDTLLNANDMAILKIRPNEIVDGSRESEDTIDNDVVMLGLISEVRQEGLYGEDSKMYRITGQSFAKAFIQFELNTVRQVTYPMAGGWLNTASDSEDEEDNFMTQITGSTVAETVEAVYDRFIDYMLYDFNDVEEDKLELSSRIETDFSSWSSDERLMDPTPFLNFEGSLNQLFNEIVTRPFCEMFFEVHTSDEGNERAKFVVRRTPFDRKDWNELPRHELQSRDVVKEDFATSDLDAYAIFNIYPENEIVSNVTSLVKPKYHPALLSKYGYRMLEVIHRYLSPITEAEIEEEGEDDGEETEEESAAEDEEASNLIETYSERLYNWYGMNPNFYNGDIEVVGHPDYRLGNRLLYKDTTSGEYWEFYLESIEHTYSYTGGYTTNLGVTRGLRLSSPTDEADRFYPVVGEPHDFKGGYLGEPSIADAIAAQEAANGSAGGGSMAGVENSSGLVRPAEGQVTSTFGPRWGRMHNGTDIAGGSDTIRSMADGKVVTATTGTTQGNYIEIEHGNLNGGTNVKTRYLHLREMMVSVGDSVTSGQQIGVMGNTGNSTGKHLHFEIHTGGSAIDPQTWITW